MGTLLTSPSDSSSPRLVEFKMSERDVPITIAQRVVIKFQTNENVGPNEIWRRLRAQYGESTLSKTQVKFWHKEFHGGTDAVQNTSHRRPRTSITQRISQRFKTLLKAIVGLLWLKFVRSLVRVSAMGACSPSTKTSCYFEKFRPDGYPGC